MRLESDNKLNIKSTIYKMLFRNSLEENYVTSVFNLYFITYRKMQLIL